jgi:acyl carrier protein
MDGREAIVQRLQGVFQDVFEDPELQIFDAMTAADIEEWDSLQHIMLVLAIERAFAVKLNPVEVGRLADVGSMVDLLAARAATVA